jgi:uncharacterized protein YbjT (DUF2867 family)
MAKILVVGASGTVGSELSRRLAAAGHTVVRATHRPPSGPQEVQLDLVARTGIEAAVDQVDRAFLLAPPGHVNQDALLKPLIDAARARKLDKVVLMTAMGANADERAPLRQAELHLQRSGLAWNVIRPNWFMQNFNTFWLPGIRAHGTIALPVGNARGSFIDARDIAGTAAALLDRHDLDGGDFDLTGPRALDHDEAAAIISRETGRAVTFRDITPEAMLQGLIDANMPGPYAEFLVMILGFFKAGYAERTTDAVQHITGRTPGTFEQYARDYRSAWVG